jgi:ketosteroid isomerase-like protein
MSQENVEVVRRFFQEVLSRDPRLDETWRVALDYVDADFEYREDPAWPGAGTYRGIPAFRQVVSGYSEAFPAMTLQADEFFDAGDRVVVFISFWARGQSGADALMRQAGIYSVRQGRVASWQVVFDRDEALEAVGLSEQDAHADS